MGHWNFQLHNVFFILERGSFLTQPEAVTPANFFNRKKEKWQRSVYLLRWPSTTLL